MILAVFILAEVNFFAMLESGKIALNNYDVQSLVKNACWCWTTWNAQVPSAAAAFKTVVVGSDRLVKVLHCLV